MFLPVPPNITPTAKRLSSSKCLTACLLVLSCLLSVDHVTSSHAASISIAVSSLPPSERESGLSSVTPPSISPRMRARVSPNHTHQSYFSEKIDTNAGGRDRNREIFHLVYKFPPIPPRHLVIKYLINPGERNLCGVISYVLIQAPGEIS